MVNSTPTSAQRPPPSSSSSSSQEPVLESAQRPPPKFLYSASSRQTTPAPSSNTDDPFEQPPPTSAQRPPPSETWSSIPGPTSHHTAHLLLAFSSLSSPDSSDIVPDPVSSQVLSVKPNQAVGNSESSLLPSEQHASSPSSTSTQSNYGSSFSISTSLLEAANNHDDSRDDQDISQLQSYNSSGPSEHQSVPEEQEIPSTGDVQSREEFKARWERCSGAEEEEDYRCVLLPAEPSPSEYIPTSSSSRSNCSDNEDVVPTALLTDSIASGSNLHPGLHPDLHPELHPDLHPPPTYPPSFAKFLGQSNSDATTASTSEAPKLTTAAPKSRKRKPADEEASKEPTKSKPDTSEPAQACTQTCTRRSDLYVRVTILLFQLRVSIDVNEKAMLKEDSKSLPDSHLFTTPLACTSLYGYMESTHDPSLPENDIDIDLSHDLDIDGSVTLRTSLMPFEEDLFDIPDTQNAYALRKRTEKRGAYTFLDQDTSRNFDPSNEKRVPKKNRTHASYSTLPTPYYALSILELPTNAPSSIRAPPPYDAP
ncbi:hypothetical protein BM1_10513 [Bipolaris maydis]|nr:hypothetical protein BM1_10513 [Bipolaris maydis]